MTEPDILAAGTGGGIAGAILAVAYLLNRIFTYLISNRKQSHKEELDTVDRLDDLYTKYQKLIDKYEELSSKYTTLQAEYQALRGMMTAEQIGKYRTMQLTDRYDGRHYGS